MRHQQPICFASLAIFAVKSSLPRRAQRTQRILRSLDECQSMGHGVGKNIGVQHDDHSDDGAKRNGVPNHKTENDAFITHLIGGRGRDGDRLSIHHLPMTPPALLAAHIRTGSTPSC